MNGDQIAAVLICGIIGLTIALIAWARAWADRGSSKDGD